MKAHAHEHDSEQWEPPVNLLALGHHKTMADVSHEGITLTAEDIHALGLIEVGGFDSGDISEVYWAVPTGEPGESPHADDCPVCHEGTEGNIDVNPF